MWYQELFYRLAIFGIKDAVEIGGITGLLYYFSVWLKQDHQKPLVLYFYGLCSVIIIAHFAGLPTLSDSLIALCPAILMLFILIHQKSLQKSFVALKNIQPSQIIQSNWLDTLLRACLIATNHKQKICCLIEGNDALGELVTAPFTLKSKIQPLLLETLLNSSSFDQQKMIWVSNTGLLLGINVTWCNDNLQKAQGNQTIDDWQQNNLLFTAQTDALAFRINPLDRTFDIVVEGKLLEKITIDQAVKLMQRYFTKKINQEPHGKLPKNHPSHQLHS